MTHLTTAAFFLLAIGILTSVSILGVHQVLIAVPSIYFLYRAIKDKRISFSKSSIFLSFFFVWCLISLIFNYTDLDDPSKSFGKLKFLFFALSTPYVLLYWIPKVKPAHLKFIVYSFLSSIILCSVVAIYQVITIGGRSEGLIGIMRYGYASAMILTLLIGILVQNKTNSFQINLKFLSTTIILGFIGLILTQTRGALIGLICALPVILYFYRAKLALLVGAVSGLLVSTVLLAYLFGSGDYGHRYLKSRNNGGDVVRREQWQSAIIATKEHPIVGWGYSNFYSQVERIKNQYGLETTSYVNEHAHNIFLETAAGTGVVGLVLFVFWLIFWAYECLKLPKSFSGIFFPFGVCMIISGQFEVIFDTNCTVLLFFVYGVSQYLLLNQQFNQKKSHA